jgi:peptide/nickel transport system substrate-binding protein
VHARSWLSVAMLALGASLLVAAGFASPAGSKPAASAKAGKSELKRGGSLRVNLPGSDFDDVDPSIAYGVDSWSVQYSTALKLLNYPDAPAPRGSRLVPEGASRYTVSRDGRTYTFFIRKGMRFSNGRPVAAANYAYALNRAADKDLQSPAFQFIADPHGASVVGAQAVRDGRARTMSGVRASGNKLVIRLSKGDPTFLAKIAMPFFQAVPTNLSRTQKIITVNDRNDLPSAGPYYISSREPNRSLTLRRNPFYKGARPRNLDTINVRVQVNVESAYREVRANQADYTTLLPPTAPAELGRIYGVNRSQFRVVPSACTSFIAMNNSNPLFANNPALRRAVNYVINRTALVQLGGAYNGVAHDQMLPIGFPGYKPANLYPNRPNISRAKALARGKTRSGKGVFFYGLTSPGPQRMELMRSLLKQIGIEIEPRGFRGYAIYDAAGKRGSDHAFSTGGWCKDYPDPYDFINVLLYGGNIQAENNNNYSYFNNRSYNRKMERAAKLLGNARLKAYGNLDIDIMKNQAPTAVWNNPTNQFFIGGRVDPKSFVYQPIYENPPYNVLALKR